MVNPVLQSAIEGLSLDERLELVEYIESTVDLTSIEVTEEQKAILRARSAELSADPSIGLSWDELDAPNRFSLGVTARRLVFHPGVEEDLKAILTYYGERDSALPSRFRARLKEQMDGLLLFPESGAPLFENYRRVLLRRFPYMAVYVTSENRIEVLALVSVRRDPESMERVVAGRAEEPE